MDWSTRTAQHYAAQGRTQEWVDAYLRTGKWNNTGLADGLKKAPRWWLGPLLIPVDEMTRTCGPGAEMAFQETQKSWEHKTKAIAQDLSDAHALPPVIAESKNDQLHLRDGNHRHGVAQEKGWESMWALIWFNSEEEMKNSKFYKNQQLYIKNDTGPQR